MKLNFTTSSQIPRIIVSIIVGLLLVLFPDFFYKSIMLFIGGLVVLASVVQLVIYFMNRDNSQVRRNVPFGAILQLVIGVIILLKADLFTQLLIFSLGFILILAALGQIAMYLSLRKSNAVPKQLYIFPIVILLAGLISIANPFATAVSLVIFFGCIMLLYGLAELFALYFIKPRSSNNSQNI